MRCRVSPRSSILVAAVPVGDTGDERSGSLDGGQGTVQLLAHLYGQAQTLLGQLADARAELEAAAAGSDSELRGRAQTHYNVLVAAKAKLDESCKALEAQLPGAGAPVWTVPEGPPRGNLHEEAWHLEPAADIAPGMFKLTSPDGAVQELFYDPLYCQGIAMDWLDGMGKATLGCSPAPLYIIGLIKTGKSYFLTKVLPGIVAQHKLFKDKPVTVMNLNLDGLPVHEGWESMKRHLLCKIVGQAKRHRMHSVALQTAAQVLAGPPDARIEHTLITDIFEEISTDTLVLIDEVRTLLMPRKPGQQVLDDGAMPSVRSLLKSLTCYSSPKCMLVVTGGSLAFLGMQLGQTVTNGISPVMHQRKVPLPSLHDRAARKLVLDHHLQNATPTARAALSPSADKFLEWSENAAVLTYAFKAACNRVPVGGGQLDVDVLTAELTVDKLMQECAADWGLVLKSFDREKRQHIAALAVRTLGCDLDGLINAGLKALLEPLTEPVAPHSRQRFLSSAYHRAAVQLLVDLDGEVREDRDWAALLRGRHVAFQDVRPAGDVVQEAANWRIMNIQGALQGI